MVFGYFVGFLFFFLFVMLVFFLFCTCFLLILKQENFTKVKENYK